MQEWRLDDEDSRRRQHLQEPGRLHAVREHWQITQPCSFDLLSETRESGSRESAGRFSFLIGLQTVLACPALPAFVRHGTTRMTAAERRRYNNMPAIGITGGISTGKSSFVECLRELLPDAQF